MKRKKIVKLLILIISLIFTFSLFSVSLSYAWTLLGGGDHEGQDWIPDGSEEIAGVHTNIGTFSIEASTTVYVKGYDGLNLLYWLEKTKESL